MPDLTDLKSDIETVENTVYTDLTAHLSSLRSALADLSTNLLVVIDSPLNDIQQFKTDLEGFQSELSAVYSAISVLNKYYTSTISKLRLRSVSSDQSDPSFARIGAENLDMMMTSLRDLDVLTGKMTDLEASIRSLDSLDYDTPISILEASIYSASLTATDLSDFQTQISDFDEDHSLASPCLDNLTGRLFTVTSEIVE